MPTFLKLRKWVKTQMVFKIVESKINEVCSMEAQMLPIHILICLQGIRGISPTFPCASTVLSPNKFSSYLLFFPHQMSEIATAEKQMHLENQTDWSKG
jgi:hypothetical protein